MTQEISNHLKTTKETQLCQENFLVDCTFLLNLQNIELIIQHT